MAGLEKRHAIAATGNQKRFEFQFFAGGFAAASSSFRLLPMVV